MEAGSDPVFALPGGDVMGKTVGVDLTYCPTNAGTDSGTLGIETDNRDARLRNVFVPLTGGS